ncbi:MAG: DNA polymerase III subunit gamma/tau C-terminal domain-containing protein, partial [Gallionella sp.]|nr:DNA polymerase III subunit gamma/tau C-terminal domain-containing protein [Gallionella sp.]
DLQLFYQIAIHGRAEIDLAPDEYAGFTMTLLRMLAFSPSVGVASRGLSVRVSSQSAVVGVSAVAKASAEPPLMPLAPVMGRDSGEAQPAKSGFTSLNGAQPNWASLVAQLNIQAMAQQLAKHCLLEELAEQLVVLRLAPEFKHLQTRLATENLQAALAEYFGRPLKLSILLGKAVEATPAKIEHQAKQNKQQQASESIQGDTFVTDAQEELDATLLVESIKSN